MYIYIYMDLLSPTDSRLALLCYLVSLKEDGRRVCKLSLVSLDPHVLVALAKMHVLGLDATS